MEKGNLTKDQAIKNYRKNYVVPCDGTTELLSNVSYRARKWPFKWYTLVPEWAQRESCNAYPGKVPAGTV